MEVTDLEIADWENSRVTQLLIQYLNNVRNRMLESIVNSPVNRDENCGYIKGIDKAINIITTIIKSGGHEG